MDFSELFTETDKDYALGIIERLFGGIVPYLRDGTGTASVNWLSDMFYFFNMAGLLVALIVISYTAYTAMFDTASDGKTFGQNTDTRHTVMRVLAGSIALIPVSGGFSLAQVALIWLTIQSSYLADTAWTRTAALSLSGQSLLAPPSMLTMDDYVVQEQFAKAYDALVLGHICAFNANDIKSTLAGLDEDALSRRTEPMALVVQSPGPQDVTGFFAAINSVSIQRQTLRHTMYFAESSDTSGYSGRKNICGGVEHNDDLIIGGLEHSSFKDGVINTQKVARFNAYVAVMSNMAQDANDLAWKIYNDERDTSLIEVQVRADVTRATKDYLTGVTTTNTVSTAELEAVEQELLDRAVEFGWAFAPSWQRGIAMAGASQGGATEGFSINATRASEVDDILGFVQGFDPVVKASLRMAEDDELTWDLMESTVRNLGEPGAASEYAPISGNGAFEPGGLVNRLYRGLLSWFAVSGGSGTGSSIYTDPMVDVTAYGKGLMTAGGVMMGAGYLSEIALGAATRGVIAENEVSTFIKTVGWGFFLAGFVTATIIPLIPFIYFYSAVVSWVLLVVEAMFAIPLAVLTLFAPAREGTLIGSWNKVLLSIFGIFLRPLFTIIGLIFGMMIISLALSYLYDMFAGMMGFMAPGGSWFSLISLFGFVAVFLIVTLYTVLIGSSLITELGDGAMNWLNIGLSSLAQRMNVGQAVTDAANVQGRTVGLATNANVGRTAIGGTVGKAKSTAGNVKGIAKGARMAIPKGF